MSEKPAAIPPQELGSLRQNIDLLRSQTDAGQIDTSFLSQQLDRLADLLQRVEQVQQQQRQAARFEALYHTSRLLGTSLDLQVVLDHIMDAIITLTQAERGFLMLRDDDGRLTVKVARNFDRQTLDSEGFSFSRTIVNQTFDKGQAIVTTNAAEDPRFAGQASVVVQGLRSIMTTPLRARGHLIGVAYVDNRIHIGLFNTDDLAALEALMGQAAVALDNALLFEETDIALTRRLEELRQLRHIDQLLNETLDINRTLQYTLEWACRLTDAAGGYMSLRSGDNSLGDITQYGEPAPLTQPPEHLPAVTQVLHTATTTRSTHNDMPVLIVPVQREQQVLGILLLYPQPGQIFSDEQQDLIERVVTRAAVAIENARLYAAVQAADKAKSEFVGIVAHDLKTPMTSISGYAKLLLSYSSNLDDRQQQFLHMIDNTVKRMEVLVSDLSDISRIESGHFFMEESQVAVPTIFEAVRDNMLPQIQTRQHTYHEDYAADLPPMWVDYYRLLQVLTNLVSNACKYTPEKGQIILRAWQQQDSINFSVSDNGIGLSPEAIRRLGTKFWRAEDDFTRAQPGTGLGFAITRALVEQMGSQIIIESTPGQGSTFSFSIRTTKGID